MCYLVEIVESICLKVRLARMKPILTRIHILARSVRNKLEISIIVDLQFPQEPPYGKGNF